MKFRLIDTLCRMAASAIVIGTALVFLPCQTTDAISLDPLDYFSYTYTITFSQNYVQEGDVFYADLEGKATCIKNAPIHPTEVYIRGRVVGCHIDSGNRIALNSGYATTISPVPSHEGEVITAFQEIALYFPWGSPAGKYQVTAELIEAKFKAGGLWFDVTSAFPQQQNMGYAFYKVTEPAPPQPTTTPPVQPTTTPPVVPTTSTTPPTTSAPPQTSTLPTSTPPTTTGPSIPVEPTTTKPDPGEPSIPPGATDITSFTDMAGNISAPFFVSSADGFASVSVEPGTIISGQNGKVPAWLMLSRITTSDQMAEDALVTGNAYEVLPNGSGFYPRANISLSYYDAQIPAGMDENLLLVARWDDRIEEWVAFENPIVDTEKNTASVSFYESGIYTILAPVSPPVFDIRDIQIFPTNVAPGDEVNLRCRVTNTGTVAGYYELVFKLNGSTQEVKRISLAGGESREITFSVIRNSPGTYNVEINGLTGSYQISASELPATHTTTNTTTTSAPPPNLDEEGSNWIWAVHAINGVLLLVAIILVLVWRIKKR